MSSRNYFVFMDNEVRGPFDAAAIRAMNLAPAVQVCRTGTEEWRLLGEEAPLLDAPEDSLPNPHAVAGAPLAAGRKKVFIIHGRGNRMEDAFEKLIALVRVKFRYYRSGYYADELNSNFVRYLLYDAQTNPWLKLFDRMLIGKLAISPNYPPPADWAPDKTWTLLSEYKVADKFTLHGAPAGGSARRNWANGVFAEIWQEFSRLLGCSITSQPALAAALESLRMELRPPDGGLYLETEYKDAIRARFASAERDGEAFLAMLLELQRLGDAGGDLDTIASNALYGAWLRAVWMSQYGVYPRYGRDFEFDFVNYHQSFLHLARHANSEIYLPDFPMEAIPDLEESARALQAVGSEYVRIDDHHPLRKELVDLLARLKQEGLITLDWVMSGPIKGEAEQAPEERTCGADLVHRAQLAGTPFDTPGLEELRRLAHQQDLHFIENPDDRSHPDYLAIDLSKLIGSKHSRIDMAQQLMQVRTFEEMRGIMESTGWRKIVDEYESSLEKILPRLDACVAAIDFIDPRDSAAPAAPRWLNTILRWITFGAFDLEAFLLRRKGSKPHRIVMTLAPFQSRKEHRINIASALNYLKNHFRYDYFFYAWGSSLLSTRRYNDKDQALDLSVLMSIIGGPGDGGHPSAATCKPPSNPAWPKERFSRLNAKNFPEYAKYIAGRIAAGTGMRIVSVRMLTEKDRDATGPDPK